MRDIPRVIRCKYFKNINLTDYENCYLVFYYLHHCNIWILCCFKHEKSMTWVWSCVWRMVDFYMEDNKAETQMTWGFGCNESESISCVNFLNHLIYREQDSNYPF